MKKNLLYLAINIAIVANCNGQYPNWGWGPAITVTLNGSSITCSVYDPVLGQNMTSSQSNATNYINSQGVVAWNYSYNAHVVIYDVNLHSFKSDSWGASTTTFSHFTNTDGVVAWTNEYTANVAVYNPVQQQWDYDYWYGNTSTFSNFTNANGVVAWSNDYNVSAVMYSSQQWKYDWWAGSTTTFSNFINAEGVVAWSNSDQSNAAVYDPFLQQWKRDYWYNSTATYSHFINAYGVVAWSNDYNANAAVYDPVQQQWKRDWWGASTTTFSAFNVTNGTLNYANSSTNYQKGYNINSHQWQDNYSTNIYCMFYNSTSNGNAPVITFFNCLSVGANSYSYNCGDGHTIIRRWAWKQYDNAGSYSPQLTVFNSSNNSTCNATINVGVGIEELNATNNIAIFPNPVHSQLIIDDVGFTISKIEIYNLIGEKIFNQQPEANGSKLYIDVSSLSPGIYCVKVKREGQEQITKLVKQ